MKYFLFSRSEKKDESGVTTSTIGIPIKIENASFNSSFQQGTTVRAAALNDAELAVYLEMSSKNLVCIVDRVDDRLDDISEKYSLILITDDYIHSHLELKTLLDPFYFFSTTLTKRFQREKANKANGNNNLLSPKKSRSAFEKIFNPFGTVNWEDCKNFDPKKQKHN